VFPTREESANGGYEGSVALFREEDALTTEALCRLLAK
jgi:hypothetical protein